MCLPGGRGWACRAVRPLGRGGGMFRPGGEMPEVVPTRVAEEPARYLNSPVLSATHAPFFTL